ncbi:hypothetical protein B0H19DRAFT_1328776 [Mycena capillaripes]|nr:hypothetical protein B0H19DRAFT_1328776 [Mycena capillaripes]
MFGQQNIERPLKDRYICCVVDLDADLFSAHPEDEPNLMARSNCLRFIVCMGWEGSDRLQKCQYVQSDIGFKRVVGFYEFELGGWEHDAHTFSAVVFCRIFLNRQTAVAHHKIIQAIEDIVLEDTGRGLQWRHIHGAHPHDYDGKILQWAADQHVGQAKGLGLHLQHISQMFPDKMDLHEPHRKLASLTPYDHLHRKFRLCVNHAYRNIQKLLGGKPACDWVANKERSHFAFEGICWAKSFIPKLVWQAGERTSNLIEAVHADVNQEGVHYIEGKLLIRFKPKLTLRHQAFEGTGIRSSYSTGHLTENILRSLKRKFNSYCKGLEAEDKKICEANSKIQYIHNHFLQARSGLNIAAAALLNCNPVGHPTRHTALLKAVGQAEKCLLKGRDAYRKEVEIGKLLVGTGSGQVPLVYAAADKNANLTQQDIDHQCLYRRDPDARRTYGKRFGASAGTSTPWKRPEGGIQVRGGK